MVTATVDEAWTQNIGQGTRNNDSVIKPFVFSHGTCECRNLKESRKFYEEFLGLDCVQIANGGMVFTLGLKFHVVCLELGEHIQGSLTMLNHWGLEVASREEVREAYEKVHELKDKYKIGTIMPIESVGGRYSFYFEDLDSNWWEIQHYKGCMQDDFFDFGDTTE